MIRPDGNRDIYAHVVSPGSVTVLARDDSDRVMLTRQWIYTHRSTQWRLPGGGIDPDDDSALAAARRELAEETGLAAGDWELAGRVHEADSFSNHVDSIFFASDLTSCEQQLRPGEKDLAVCWMSFESVFHLALSGELPHAGSAQAVLLMAVRRQRMTSVCSARSGNAHNATGAVLLSPCDSVSFTVPVLMDEGSCFSIRRVEER